MSPEAYFLRSLFSSSGAYLRPSSGETRVSNPEASYQELLALGYDIEHHPHLGYRLKHAPDILIPDEVQGRLSLTMSPPEVQVFKETESTNDLLLKETQHLGNRIRVVATESQTKGRGRQGRTWISQNPKGLWMSVLWRKLDEEYFGDRLSVITSVALHRALSRLTQLSLNLKWPNDLIHKDKKIAGILVESGSTSHSGRHAVIGIGCNLNQEQKEFPHELRKKASSLKILTGHTIRRADVMVEFLDEMGTLLTSPWEPIREEWKKLCLHTGQEVDIYSDLEQGIKVSGIMEDINEFGHLMLRDSSDTLHSFAGGEVSLRVKDQV